MHGGRHVGSLWQGARRRACWSGRSRPPRGRDGLCWLWRGQCGVPVKPVLEGSAPQWGDGYNHFILTMSGPVPLVADGSLTRGRATAKPARGQRAAGNADQAVRPAAQVSVRLAAQASVWLGAGNAPGVVTKGAHSPQGATGPQGAASSQGARSTTTTANPATTTTAAGATTTTAQVTTTTGPGGTIAGPGGMTLAPVSGSDPIGGVTVGEWPAFTASQLISDNGGSAGSAVDGVDV